METWFYDPPGRRHVCTIEEEERYSLLEFSSLFFILLAFEF